MTFETRDRLRDLLREGNFTIQYSDPMDNMLKVFREKERRDEFKSLLNNVLGTEYFLFENDYSWSIILL